MVDIRPARRTWRQELKTWPVRRWWFAGLMALGTTVLVAIPTDLIPNPIFHRDVPPTWWAWPVLLVTAVLSGLVGATYVARKDPADSTRSGVLGTGGALLTFFAVGCPVCNKLALLALGYAGALQFFAPLQPILAVGAIVLLALALRTRIRNEGACPLPTRSTTLTPAEVDLGSRQL